MSVWASQLIALHRLATCRACPFYTVTIGVARCRVCKCVLQAKVRIATQTCPLRKW